MAIALDSSGQSTNGNASLTASYTHTCSGTNRLLVVTIWNESGAASDNMTSVTYNGIAMTLLDQSYSSGQYGLNTYYLVNPASGANTVLATRTSATNGFVVMGSSYTGVRQTSTIVDHQVTRTGGTLTGNTSTTSGCWAVIAGSGSGNISASTGTTLRASGPGANTQGFFGDSNGTVATGSYSMAITGLSQGGQSLLSFAPDDLLFDNSIEQTVATALNSKSITVGSGATNYVVVFAAFDNGNTMLTPPTVGGAATTLLQTNTGVATFTIYAYGIANVTPGINVVAFTGTGLGNWLGAVSWTGTGTGQPNISSNTTGSTSTSFSQSVTTTVNNSLAATWVLATGASLAASTNSTSLGTLSGGAVGMFKSSAYITPAGSYSMVVTASSGQYEGIMVAVSPPSISTVNSGFFRAVLL